MRHALQLLGCAVQAAANAPTPMDRAGAELRHSLRDGDAQGFLRWCDELGSGCAQADTFQGDSLLHVAAEHGRYNIAKYLVVNLGLEADIHNFKGLTSLQRCGAFPDSCEPGTWEAVLTEATEMRRSGEKMSRDTLKEDVAASAGGAPVNGAGLNPAEKLAAKKAAATAQQERLDAYAAVRFPLKNLDLISY